MKSSDCLLSRLNSLGFASSKLDPHMALGFLVNKNLEYLAPFRAYSTNLLFDFQVESRVFLQVDLLGVKHVLDHHAVALEWCLLSLRNHTGSAWMDPRA